MAWRNGALEPGRRWNRCNVACGFSPFAATAARTRMQAQSNASNLNESVGMTISYPRFKGRGVSCRFGVSRCGEDRRQGLRPDRRSCAQRRQAGGVSRNCSFPVFRSGPRLQAPIHSHDFFAALADQAVLLDGPEIDKVRMAARRHGVVVSLGITEGTEASVGCLWNSNVLIGLGRRDPQSSSQARSDLLREADLGERRRPRPARGRQPRSAGSAC